ncbi:MAG: transglycosylase SLT domain-containing protein [Dehalococcoidia bacterium]
MNENVSNEEQRPPVQRPVTFGVLTGGLLIAALLAVSWSGGPALAQDDPTPVPTATPSPPDAALAAELAHQGRIDAAIGAYEAVIAQRPQDERLSARLALAKVYLGDDDVASAIRQLDAYLIEAPPGSDVRDAQFLLAESLLLEGAWAETVPLYDAYISGAGAAFGYAWIGRAEALTRLGLGPGPAVVTEILVGDLLPDAVRLRFVLSIAQALEADYPAEALEWYQRLGDESDVQQDQALVLWRSALLQRELGGSDQTPEAWTEIVQRYPETALAQELLDSRPGNRLLPMDPYYLGLAYYRGGESGLARGAFEDSIDANADGGDGSLAARASYYLAVLDENAGDVDAAVVGYGRVVELHPDVDLADDALWWQGRLLELDGRTSQAIESYERLVDEYGSSDWGREARFRLPLLDYDAGRYDQAAAAFEDIADSTSEEERWRALLWQGKALLAAESGDAEAIWVELVDEADSEYYGLRAALLLGDTSGGDLDADLDVEAPDWLAVEAWLVESDIVSAAELLAAQRALEFDQHRRWGEELIELGLPRSAATELALVLEDAGRNPASLYMAARWFQDADVIDLSSKAATRLLFALPDAGREAAPVELWQLAYPAPFAGLLEDAADESDVPNLLFLALIRQESFFDPLAGSTAGALGLAQVIPPTGETIAEERGVAGFEVHHLFRPVVSLEFGAHYLGGQLDEFDGNFYQALAAFNAGPVAATRWADASGDDIDRFVAEIDFTQTRAYVQLVSENLARYRQIYQDRDAPELPRD